MTDEEKSTLLAWSEANAPSSEWYGLRAIALRLHNRGYDSEEIATSLHAWVDDAVKTLKRIESDEVADTMPAAAGGEKR